jgi:aspartate racemase
MKKKAIGILGGMGPESTALFYSELIKQCQKQYGAQYDEDYPEIFIYSLPIPDIVRGIKRSDTTREMMTNGIKKIEKIGSQIITMPCNSAEYFYDDIKKKTTVPFFSMIEKTAQRANANNYKNVGLLATETTLDNKLYENIFSKYAINIIKPSNQKTVTDIICNILAGNKSQKDKEEIIKIIEQLKTDGADAVILGCTDLPILINQIDTKIPLLNTVKILAEATIKYSIK